LSRCFKR